MRFVKERLLVLALRLHDEPNTQEFPDLQEIMMEIAEDVAFETAIRNAQYYDFDFYNTTMTEILRLTAEYLELNKQFRAEYKAYILNGGDDEPYTKTSKAAGRVRRAICKLWEKLGVSVEAYFNREHLQKRMIFQADFAAKRAAKEQAKCPFTKFLNRLNPL